jgi:2-iminoacetate synthase ThiH
MNPSIQPETSSPLRVKSPIGQAETPTITEVNPPPLQPEASDLPETAPAPSQTDASALLRALQTSLSPVAQEIPLETEQNLSQLRKSGMR